MMTVVEFREQLSLLGGWPGVSTFQIGVHLCEALKTAKTLKGKGYAVEQLIELGDRSGFEYREQQRQQHIQQNGAVKGWEEDVAVHDGEKVVMALLGRGGEEPAGGEVDKKDVVVTANELCYVLVDMHAKGLGKGAFKKWLDVEASRPVYEWAKANNQMHVWLMCNMIWVSTEVEKVGAQLLQFAPFLLRSRDVIKPVIDTFKGEWESIVHSY